MVVIVLGFLGFMDVYDFVRPDNVPDVYFIGYNEHRHNAKYINGGWYAFSDDPEENWKKLQPSLAILRKVCPEAAKWVEDRHDKGKIVWEKGTIQTYARYDRIDEKLILCDCFLCKRDGEKAVTLAHEFRHSRQGWTKTVRRALAMVLTGTDHDYFVENDAYDFERQVYIAIYGN